MKSIQALSLPLLLLLVSLDVSLAESNVSGPWTGSIELPNGGRLGISVTLAHSEDVWSGQIDIPAQGLKDFSLSNVSVVDETVHFEMSGIPGHPVFEGTLAPSGAVIAGSLQQGANTQPFSLTRAPAPGAEPPSEVHAEIPAEGIPGEGIAGAWVGGLDAGSMTLRLLLSVDSPQDGNRSASLNSVDQGALIEVTNLEFEGRSLTFELPSIGAGFRGSMNEEGSRVEGIWSQSGRRLPLTFHRTSSD